MTISINGEPARTGYFVGVNSKGEFSFYILGTSPTLAEADGLNRLAKAQIQKRITATPVAT